MKQHPSLFSDEFEYDEALDGPEPEELEAAHTVMSKRKVVLKELADTPISKERIAEIAAIPDEAIDTSDIPEVVFKEAPEIAFDDWSVAEPATEPEPEPKTEEPPVEFDELLWKAIGLYAKRHSLTPRTFAEKCWRVEQKRTQDWWLNEARKELEKED